LWRLGELENRDIIMGIVLIALTLEMTRRVMGWALPIVALSAIVYAFAGHKIPGLFGHGGIGVERLVGQLYCTLEGIYGVAIGVMVSFIYFFILFGAMLIKTGAANFFIDLAFSITGKSVGGPAKASVLASGTMSMINGSAQANVVTTGCFTIPTMIKIGYPPHTAAAVETAASAGGIFTPPIMGAGAFIMADWLGISYFEVIKAAAIPAGLYFFSLFLFVHTAALKLNIGRLSHKYNITMKKLIREGSPFLTSIALLIYFLVRGYSPQYAVLISMLALLVVGMFFKETRLSPKEFIAAIVLGAKNTILASAACACAGIVIGVVGLTGVGLKFSTIVLSLSGGNLFLGIILVLLASLVLGMGLTVTPAYITLAVLAVPALVKLGLSPLAAHMIIFWFSQDSQVTPPVCVTAYTAAAVARSDPFRTGLSAWALAKGLYIIPIFMAYTHILGGTASQIVVSTIICAACLFSFNGFMHGYIFCKLSYVERLNFGISAGLFMVSDYRSWIIAAILLLAGVIIQKIKSVKKSAVGENLLETFEKQQT
jgi:TRAP transporter 4TM/12TM fusion protein